jgi:hypothetical protein
VEDEANGVATEEATEDAPHEPPYPSLQEDAELSFDGGVDSTVEDAGGVTVLLSRLGGVTLVV